MTEPQIRDLIRWLTIGAAAGGIGGIAQSFLHNLEANDQEVKDLNPERRNDRKLIIRVKRPQEKLAKFDIVPYVLPAAALPAGLLSYLAVRKIYEKQRTKELEAAIDDAQRGYLKVIAGSLKEKDLEDVMSKMNDNRTSKSAKNLFETKTLGTTEAAVATALLLSALIGGGTIAYNALDKEYGKAFKLHDNAKKDYASWRDALRPNRLEIVYDDEDPENREKRAADRTMIRRLYLSMACAVEKQANAPAILPVVSAASFGFWPEVKKTAAARGWGAALSICDGLDDSNLPAVARLIGRSIVADDPQFGKTATALAAGSLADLHPKIATSDFAKTAVNVVDGEMLADSCRSLFCAELAADPTGLPDKVAALF